MLWCSPRLDFLLQNYSLLTVLTVFCVFFRWRHLLSMIYTSTFNAYILSFDSFRGLFYQLAPRMSKLYSLIFECKQITCNYWQHDCWLCTFITYYTTDLWFWMMHILSLQMKDRSRTLKNPRDPLKNCW